VWEPKSGQNIRFHLVAIRQGVGRVKKGDNSQNLPQGRVVNSLLLQCYRVGIHTVPATVGGGDCEGNDLPRPGIQRARSAGSLGVHEGLEPGPNQLKLVGAGGQDSPEVRDKVDVLRPLDVGENLRDLAGGSGFGDRDDGGDAGSHDGPECGIN
jgi:hypothetical protein